MNMEIRTFELGDEDAVTSLWREVFAYEAPRNEPGFVIRSKLQTQPELFFVAIDDGAVVGTVMAGYDGHRGWIYSLAVGPSHRGRGIGTALVRHVESALHQLGCPKINLQVLSSNAEVVEFYRKLGFAVEERISMGKVI
jgi:ribosomal protein S18 acetylase RimI-like enzyme